ncbi:MAG TPA: TIGR02588 family protein, partial [Xenococcaceae cyanobacterium]
MKQNKQRSPAETVSLIISLSVVGMIIALVSYIWLTGDTNPPILSVTTESQIRQVNHQYYVPFTV